MSKVIFCGIMLDNTILWNEYAHGKQTYNQWARKYGCIIHLSNTRFIDEFFFNHSDIFVCHPFIPNRLLYSRAYFRLD